MILPKHIGGGHWRKPTMAEWHELESHCTMERVTLSQTQYIEPYNSMSDKSDKRAITSAYKFTAKNGNYIILPIAGMWYYYDPKYGDSFSSVLGIELWIIAGYWANSNYAMWIFYQEDGIESCPTSWDSIFCSVRAVWDDNK